VSENFYQRCTCPDEALCPIRDVMKEAREAVVKIMERLTLADLRDRARRLENPADAATDFVI
jgi:DNA-binding IscR family transcriptional regulator